MKYNELVEHTAIGMANLCNIPEAVGHGDYVSPKVFWRYFISSERKDTYRMEAAAAIDAAMEHVIMTSKENGNRITFMDLNEFPPKLRAG